MSTASPPVDPTAALQALLDREAIRDCLARYCRGIDRADEATLRSTYWPDASDTHGAWRGSADGFITQALSRLRRGGLRVHMVGQTLIELHGAVAAVESSFLALQARADSAAETFLCGRYVDRFERRDGEWRVAQRTVVYDWIEERARPELVRNAQALFGVRQPTGTMWPDDPVYSLLSTVRSGT